MTTDDRQDRATLESIARRAMLERGLLPDFSAAVLDELSRIQAPAASDGAREGIAGGSRPPGPSLGIHRQRRLPRPGPAHRRRSTARGLRSGSLVAVADVDALVKKGSAIDEHARHNTTSVYTAAEIFPMLPEKLSTDLTSLNFRRGPPGRRRGNDHRRGRLPAGLGYLPGARPQSGQARLQQRRGLAGGEGPAPEDIAAVRGLTENLRLQDRVAQSLKAFRHDHGALSLETIEAKPVFDGDQIRDLEVEEKNRAKEIIEDFMIAANGVTARYLSARRFPLDPPRRAQPETLGPDRRAGRPARVPAAR